MYALLTPTAGLSVSVIFISAKKSAVEKLLQKTFEVDKVITFEHRKLQNKQPMFQSRKINTNIIQRGSGIHHSVDVASQHQKSTEKCDNSIKNTFNAFPLLKEKNSFVFSQGTIIREKSTLLYSGSASTNKISNVESYENEEVNFNGFNLPSLSWIETMTLKPTLRVIDPTWKTCLVVISRVMITALISGLLNNMYEISETMSTLRFVLQIVSHRPHTHKHTYIYI